MIRTPVSHLPEDRAEPRGPEPLRAAQLYEAHADAVAGWASRLGGPKIEAEDVVQEVFVIVHRRLEQFRGDARVTSWLYGITANVVRQQRRKAWRRRWFGIGQEPVDEERTSQPTPIEEIERRRRVVAVYRVLDAMRERSRTLLILAEIEGLSGDQVAELLNLKIGTVWVSLHRARAEFSRLARKLIPDEVDAIEAERKQLPPDGPRRTR
jgi:RNA polymerase sigma-70 factor (ECF subfamily)